MTTVKRMMTLTPGVLDKDKLDRVILERALEDLKKG